MSFLPLKEVSKQPSSFCSSSIEKKEKKVNLLEDKIEQKALSQIQQPFCSSAPRKKLKIESCQQLKDLKKEFNSISINASLLQTLPYDPSFCRFSNIECLERTVVFQKEEAYLHANYVEYEGLIFCATQYPFFKDSFFWKHCFEKGQVIIDLTHSKDLYEGEKLISYVPTATNSLDCEGFLIEEIQVQNYPLNEAESLNQTKCYTYQITDKNSNQVKQIKRIHYEGWIDKEGADPEHLRKFILALTADFELEETADCFPIIHCLAGVGRTGSLMAAWMLYKRFQEKVSEEQKDQLDLKSELKEELKEIIKTIRSERHPLCIQNFEQYLTIVKTLDLFFKYF